MATFSSSFILITISVMMSVTCQAQIVPYPKPPERDVSSMCAAATCPTGTVCRVAKACSSPGCLPHVECIPCVPNGVDLVCNRRGYINTVLVGSGKDHLSMIPLYCNPMLNNDISGCPLGSVCASSDKLDFVGTCCYGKPEHLPAVNNDARCYAGDKCPQKCKKGFECQPTTSECGTLAYSCQPLYKPGRCPPIRLDTKFCANVRVGRFCEVDNDCEGDKKCCRTDCDGRACLSPF